MVEIVFGLPICLDIAEFESWWGKKTRL